MESHDNFAYLLPFIFFVFGCTFLFLQRWSSASSRYWGFGYIGAALGFASPLILTGLPVPVQAIVSNALFLAAFFFYGHAFLTRFGQSVLISERLIFCVAAFLGISYLILVEHDLRGELAVSDIACSTLLIIPLWQVRHDIRRPIDRLLGAMVGLVIADNLVRVSALLILTSSGTYASLDDFLTSDYAFFMQMTASIIGFLLALTVLGTVMLDAVWQHRHAAEHDPLTDLLNRRGFERAIPDFRRESFPSGAVLVCDIDHFKLVNDRFGHAAGDTVIVGLAAVLHEGLQSDALVARFGGEEFVAFLPGVTLAEAGVLANAIRLAFAARDWRDSGVTQQITASFGVSSTSRGDHSMHDAIGRADTCLYTAKSAGRNQVVLEGQQAASVQPQLRVISASDLRA
ncbi:diguanylate cyclase [Rhizobium sp. CF080]|uniref:GGDEF domain-containing protein n=1 Tax=Rhizobium sp. (strain CF080) TaxID=1144310 RepID=UPI0002716F29|nr:GGDEF domain-containing protein [Rhizobium sp. CF080]EUC00157.1 diguanylate cyclase [Rhizobium sp. CF080]